MTFPVLSDKKIYMKWLVLFLALLTSILYPKTSTKKAVKVKTEIATLAGGCFWGMEELIRKIPGVIDTQVGYTGGDTPAPTYEVVKTGKTGHAESVQIEFDTSKTSFEEILLNFFKMHDPTTTNRQGNDLGTQYRSAIFFHSPEQKETALKVIERVNKSGAWKKPAVTEVVQAKSFYPAEGYHQKYLVNNPGGYTCHFIRDLKF